MPFQNELKRVSKAIAKQCRANRALFIPHEQPIPSQESVKEIIGLVEQILFVGYYGKQNIPPEELDFHLEKLTRDLFELLGEQIAKSFRHECQHAHPVCDQCRENGRKDAIMVIRKLPHIKQLLDADVQAALDGDPAAKSLDEIIFSYPIVKSITVHRVAHELYRQHVPLLPRIMSEYSHSITGIDIHPGATIGRSFFIDHGTGVVIGETTLIGDHVTLYQGVTLGALSFPRDAQGNLIRDSKRHPTLEDHVTIYAGATILGGDTVIGKGSIIGGNVWLTESVPPYSKVVIEPPRLEIKIRKSRPKS